MPTTTTRYEETSPVLTYAGTWFTATDPSYSGGSIKYTYLSGSSVTATFTGTKLTWIARTGPTYGKAWVTLDGGTPVLVDLYSPSFLNQQPVWTTGSLTNGTHGVNISWSGQMNPSSSFTFVSVDAFDVAGSLAVAGSLDIGAEM